MGKIEHGLTAVAGQIEHLNHALVTRRIHHMDFSRDPLSSIRVRALHNATLFVDGK